MQIMYDLREVIIKQDSITKRITLKRFCEIVDSKLKDFAIKNPNTWINLTVK